MTGAAIHANDAAAALRVNNLSKSFPGTRALSSLELAIAPGEIRAVLGGNGSGKSTLIKILSGYHRPDPGGEVSISGRALEFGSPASSYSAGARFVHQDLVQRSESPLMVWRVAGRDWACPPAFLVPGVLGWPAGTSRRVQTPPERKGTSGTVH
jgi:hypothetical protein